MVKYIFGHKSPDTDTICATLALANLKKKLGEEVVPCRLGELNKETKYALEYFKVDAPELIKEVEEGQEVILVDHNEFSQSADGIQKAKVTEVYDHHRIYGFETAEPLYYRAEPVGSTCTIIYKMYNEKNVEIDKSIAGLMLSAVISDTLLLKSPTKTEEDERAVVELAKIADVDYNTYGLDMLKAGTDLSDLTAKELINLDAKEFDLKGIKAKVAQVNTADINLVLERKSEIMSEMNKDIDEKSIKLFAFVITDIIESNSLAIVLGEKREIFEKAFMKKIEDDLIYLPGVVSRKKQIIPPLQNNA